MSDQLFVLPAKLINELVSTCGGLPANNVYRLLRSVEEELEGANQDRLVKCITGEKAAEIEKEKEKEKEKGKITYRG